MFAGLLNKGFRGGFLLVLIYFLVTLTISFFSTIELQQDLLPNLFYNYFGNKIESKWLAIIINFAFIGIGILILGYISVEEEVVDKQNYFPTFLFLLISSAAINPFKLSPLVVTNVLILLAFYKLINTYRKDQVLKQLFDAGFLLGLTPRAFYFYPFILSGYLFYVQIIGENGVYRYLGFWFHFLFMNAWLTSVILIAGIYQKHFHTISAILKNQVSANIICH